MKKQLPLKNGDWKPKLYEVIFEANTKPGKYFDILLIICIIISVLIVMLDSVGTIRARYGKYLLSLEWFFTILFTIEYVLRLIAIDQPIRYGISFLGIIDFIAIVPTYLSAFLPGTQYFLVIRTIRILRIFRVLKLVKYVSEAKILIKALRASRRKITVFLFTVITLVTVFGSLMYVIEGEENDFSSIPRSIYWAIVTLTTVGYGDISPKTSIGQTIAAIIMILGYSIIAVPTGIVTAEMTKTYAKIKEKRICTYCNADDHDLDAKYCKFCGTKLQY